jgi:hypothetical protein
MPELCRNVGPLITEGAGKAGCPLHPQPRVRIRKAHERSHHRFTGITQPSLRNGFNGLFRALPGDRAFLSPSSARLSADLTPASRRQDHTILPSASARSSPRGRVHHIPLPTSVTIAIRPSMGTGRRGVYTGSDFGKTEIFFRSGLDKTETQAVPDLPVGQIREGVVLRYPMPWTGKTGQPAFPRLPLTGHAAGTPKSTRMTRTSGTPKDNSFDRLRRLPHIGF